MTNAATPSRFHSDSAGTVDLASVSAVVKAAGKESVAAVILEGGNNIRTATDYDTLVAAWQAYVNAEAEPTPAA